MHKSQILFWGLIFFVVSIWVASLITIPEVLFYIASVVFGITIAVSFVWRQCIVFAILLFAVLLGILRTESGALSLAPLDPIEGHLLKIRDAFSENITHALPEPHASYMAGLTVGERRAIPQDIKDAFRKTGTSHLTALSGYNVTIITQYLGRIGGSLWFPVIGIFIFVLATGAQSSLVRAAIMGVLVLVARRYEHGYDTGNALLFAVVIMLFFDPSLLLNDVGFQLSVVATAGLIYITPIINPYLWWFPKKFGMRESASATLSAQIATFPLILYYFGAPSVFSPLVNILVLIAIPATMMFGFLVGVTGFLSTILSQLFAWPGFVLLSYQLHVIQFFASLSL